MPLETVDAELGQVLRLRVHDLLGRSAAIVRQSRLVVDSGRYAREPGMLVPVCAWCGRAGVGGGWVPRRELPEFLAAVLARRSTHSICPTCLRAHLPEEAELPER